MTTSNMSKLPYVRDEGQDPSAIRMDSLRAPAPAFAHGLHSNRSQSSINSATSSQDVAPPAHYAHPHGLNNPHYFEGYAPGEDGSHDEAQQHQHTRNKESKASIQYDTLVDKEKNPYIQEKRQQKQQQQQQQPDTMPTTPGDAESSADESDDFDWDTDDSDIDDMDNDSGRRNNRIRRAKRGRRLFLALMQLARPIRILVFGLIGTAILMVPFIVTTVAFKDKPARPHVQTWSVWLSIIWAAGCGTFLILDWFPPAFLKIGVAFYGKAPPMFKTYVEVLIAIMLFIKLTLCIAWAWISLGGILAIEFPGQPNPSYFKWIFKVIKALFASGIIVIAEKFALQLVAINFHKVSLKERLETNQSALQALDRLADSKYLASKTNSRRATGMFSSFGFGTGSRPQTPGGGNAYTHHKNTSTGYFPTQPAGADLSDARDADSPKRKKGGSQTPKAFNDKDMRKNNFAAQLTDALQTATMKDSKLYRSKRMLSARRLAKKLFNAVGHHRPSLVAEDFEPFFNTTEEAREAFKHFDFDGNGDITRQEFRDGVQRIFRERRALATSLKDASSAIDKLDGVLLGIALIIMIFIWLLIFNGDNTVANIAPLSTFVVGFSFIFGNSAKTLFESMVFIFATHPYDVGDLVCVDDMFMFVQEFGLISTTFRTTTNETIVAPNALLSSSKMIFNCRRSGNQWEVTSVQVGYDTTLLEAIDHLRARMRAWVKQNDREWGGGLEINLNELQTEKNCIELIIAMEHKGNWQNWGERWSRRTQLMRQVKNEMEDLGIQYSLPKQPVTFALQPGQGPHVPRAPRMPFSGGRGNGSGVGAASAIPRAPSGRPMPVGGIGGMNFST